MDFHFICLSDLFFYESAYLASLNEPEMTQLVLNEYKSATNMTEQFAALGAIAQNAGDVRDEVLSDFYQKWKEDALVIFVSFNFLIFLSFIEFLWVFPTIITMSFSMEDISWFVTMSFDITFICYFLISQVINKWLALQAVSDIPGNVKNVQSLLEHPAFDIRNPNKVRFQYTLPLLLKVTRSSMLSPTYILEKLQLLSFSQPYLSLPGYAQEVFCDICMLNRVTQVC